jgi:2-polyprenyl-6-methoxyphenol hydroxylase-like FAD-dependent oxidoreductase
MSESTTEVLIVGAGPTGLMLACDLQRRKVPFRIVDRSETPSQQSRALGLQALSLEVFDDLGFVEQFLESGVVIKAVSCYEAGMLGSRFELETEPGQEAPYPYLVIVEQHVTEAILSNHLRRQGAVVERGVELKQLEYQPDQVRSKLRCPTGEEEYVRSSFVVGCDGAHSCVRRLSNIGFQGDNSHLLYHLADLEIAWELPDKEILRLSDGQGEVVAIPLHGERRYRLNLWEPAPVSGKPTRELSFGALEAPLDLAAWQETLQRLAPGQVTLSNPRSLMSYRSGYGLAEAYRQGRIFLAGDSSHMIPQSAAQGMNMGIQDAYNLGWKLGLVIRGDAPIELLETYQTERRPVAQLALAPTICDPSLAGKATHLESREALDKWSQLGLDYRQSSLSLRTVHDGQKIGAGHRAPDGELALEGHSVFLYDLLDGRHHHLLVFSDGDDPGLEKFVRGVKAERYPALRIHLVGIGSDAMLDRDSLLHRAYAAGHGHLILIRPDRFIAVRATLAESEHLLGYLAEHFIPQSHGFQ